MADSVSHSFTVSSSCTMADIAARVVREFENDDEEADEDSEFEFVVPGVGESFSPVSAGEIFSNGQIMPLFPLFNSQICCENENSSSNSRIYGENESESKSLADSSSNSRIYGENESESKSPADSSSNSRICGENESESKSPLFNVDSSSNSRIYGENESLSISEAKSPLFNSNSRFYGANMNSSTSGTEFPVWKVDSAGSRQTESRSESSETSIRLPLKKLLISERVTSLTASESCSEDEAEDDLEGVNSGTYCVWTPPNVEMSKKSNSTGSSKRWKLRNLVHRSHSDGREKFVFLAPKQEQRRLSESSEKTKTKTKIPATVNGKSCSKNPQRDYYLRNRAIKESDKRKSYLPYKQDLVGFFGNVNSLSRTMQPF